MDWKRAAIAVLVVYGIMFFVSGDLQNGKGYVVPPVREVWHNFLYSFPTIAVLLFVAAVVTVIMKSGGGGGGHGK